MEAPIYNEFWVVCKGKEEGIPAFFPDFSGETEGYTQNIRQGTTRDLIETLEGKDRILLVEIKHKMEGCYNNYACVVEWQDHPSLPRRGLNTASLRRHLSLYHRNMLCYN